MILLNKNLLQHTVLAKSVLKAAYRLGLNEEGLKKVLKFNDASPIVKLDPTSEFGQQGLLLIQLFQSLSSLTNGEEAAIKIRFLTILESNMGFTECLPKKVYQST